MAANETNFAAVTAMSPLRASALPAACSTPSGTCSRRFDQVVKVGKVNVDLHLHHHLHLWEDVGISPGRLHWAIETIDSRPSRFGLCADDLPPV
jgi:hypothetical protein